MYNKEHQYNIHKDHKYNNLHVEHQYNTKHQFKLNNLPKHQFKFKVKHFHKYQFKLNNHIILKCNNQFNTNNIKHQLLLKM